MPRQSSTQRKIVGNIMHEFKAGDLRSSSGQKVRNPKQAIAVALSEAGASKFASKQQNKRSLQHTLHKKTRRAGKG